MAFYTICGKPDCQHFAHACYVAQYLHEHLKHFHYKRIDKSKREWPAFVEELNKKNGWHVVKTPIIWKEISTWGGKPHLIGALSEFWEHCYSYYGLESSIPQPCLQKLASDTVKYFEDEIYKEKNTEYSVVVTIWGRHGHQDLSDQLFEDFLTIPYFMSGNGFLIKLFKGSAPSDIDKEWLKGAEYMLNSRAIFGNRPIAQIADSEEDAIENSDVLIFSEDFSQDTDDPHVRIKRCSSRIKALSNIMNVKAKRQLKVIFCNEGPACFMATCLIEYSTVLIPSNVVVLTADKGLSVISVISQLTGLPVSKIGAPPVWGFIGTNDYVDESNVIFKAHIYKPYKRALNAPIGSTLPLGTVIPELRSTSYLLPNHHQQITDSVEQRNQDIEVALRRKPIRSKLRALKSLLDLWYAEFPGDQVISLGVCSNGYYGIPPGLIFSQPCIQDTRRRWRPFSNFPLVNDAVMAKVQTCIDEAVSMVRSVGIEVHKFGDAASESDHAV